MMLYGGGILQHMHPVLQLALPGGLRVTPLEGSPQPGLLVMAMTIWPRVNYHLGAGIQRLMNSEMWVWVN